MNIHIHTQLRHRHTHRCTHIHIRKHMYTHTCTHTHTHTHTYTHTHTHTHRHTDTDTHTLPYVFSAGRKMAILYFVENVLSSLIDTGGTLGFHQRIDSLPFTLGKPDKKQQTQTWLHF